MGLTTPSYENLIVQKPCKNGSQGQTERAVALQEEEIMSLRLLNHDKKQDDNFKINVLTISQKAVKITCLHSTATQRR
jgi:hypothetical protein